MKTKTNRLRTKTVAAHSALRTGGAFTLIELLVVISIIAILAALLLPAISKARLNAQKAKAKLQVGQIANAVNTYETDNSGKFPVSSVGPAPNAMAAASAVTPPEDFTFGGQFKKPDGTFMNVWEPGVSYTIDNSEVMAVLMDVERWPNATADTINKGHVKNPQRTHYLNASSVNATNQPGVGPDGVYRDPWNNPYVITVDLNYDGKARDAFYRSKGVSEDGNSTAPLKGGLIGLSPALVNGTPVYEANSPVMVWSAGPDGTIDPNEKADKGANKDNILSWKQ
jgi:prepilin-type N-terminal cleavage/methylation domain-containing protein